MTTKSQILKVIKLQCQECIGSTVARKGEFDKEAGHLVEGCSAPECSLFPFRMGKDPWPTRKQNRETAKKGLLALSVKRRKRQISTISPNAGVGKG